MYYFKSRIRYSEVDENGILTIGNAVNYLQDCSTFQSEDLGVGLDFLREHQAAWILSAWQIEFLELPHLKEQVIIGTWAYDFKGIYGYRNFQMKNEEGKELIKANSIWVYFDTIQGRPVKAAEEDRKRYGMEERLEMEYLPRKITVPEGGICQEPILIRRHHIDTNHHVNNGQYIQLAQDYLPPNLKPKRLRADYRKAAVLGDTMIPRVVPIEEGYIVIMEEKDGKPYVIIEFTNMF